MLLFTNADWRKMLRAAAKLSSAPPLRMESNDAKQACLREFLDDLERTLPDAEVSPTLLRSKGKRQVSMEAQVREQLVGVLPAGDRVTIRFEDQSGEYFRATLIHENRWRFSERYVVHNGVPDVSQFVALLRLFFAPPADGYQRIRPSPTG